MSTSIVHVLAIIGKGGEEVEVACEELLARKTQSPSSGYGSNDWTERDHKDIGRFCRFLVDAAQKLPVIYYAQYMDPWTVADSRYYLLTWPDGKRRHICGSNFGLVFYPSAFSRELSAEIERKRQTQLYRDQAEVRWFLDHLKEALECAQWLNESFLVVSISEVLGPSRQDEDILRSLNTSVLAKFATLPVLTPPATAESTPPSARRSNAAD